MVWLLLDIENAVLQANTHILKSLYAFPQYAFELGLVKVIVAGATVGPQCGGTAPDQQGLAFGIDKMHAFKTRARNAFDLTA